VADVVNLETHWDRAVGLLVRETMSKVPTITDPDFDVAVLHAPAGSVVTWSHGILAVHQSPRKIA